jgi:hypothetical protein
MPLETIANLIDHAQLGTEVTGQRSSGQRLLPAYQWVVKLRMIEGIEQFRPQLHLMPPVMRKNFETTTSHLLFRCRLRLFPHCRADLSWIGQLAHVEPSVNGPLTAR